MNRVSDMRIPRMVFLVTLVLIVSLLVPSTISILADENVPVFTPDDCHCPDLGTELDLDNPGPYDTDDVEGLHCEYFSEAKEYLPGSGAWRDFKLTLIYCHETETVGQLRNVSPTSVNDHLKKANAEPDYYVTIEAIDTANRTSLLWTTTSQDNWYTGFRTIRYDDHYVILIEGRGRGFTNELAFEDAINRLEQHANGIIQAQKGIKFTVQHFHPITSDSKEYTAGDLVAFLKDKNGRGISGQDVFFFKQEYLPEDVALEKCIQFPENSPLSIDETSVKQLGLGKLSDDYAVDSTDADWSGSLGEARFNYLGSIDYTKLLDRLQKRGPVSGKVYAVVFDKDPRVKYLNGTEAQVQFVQTIPIEFKGVAAITSRGKVDGSKDSVIKIGGIDANDSVVGYDGALPHYLLEDIIYFNNNTIFTIKWLNGLVMTFVVKKDHLTDAEWESVRINYKDAGWYQWFDQTFGNCYVECTVSIAPTAIGMYMGGAAGAVIGGPISLGIGAVILVYEGVQDVADPLIVQPHSKILINLDENPSVFTMEGTARLFEPDDGNSIDVDAGFYVNRTSDGEFGTVEQFKERELDSDLVDMLATMREESTSTSDTIIPSQPGGIIGLPDITPVDVPQNDPLPDFDSDSSSDFGGVFTYIGIITLVVVFAAIMFIGGKRRRKAVPVSMMPPATPGTGGPFCSKCGNQVPSDAAFCKKCGSKI